MQLYTSPTGPYTINPIGFALFPLLLTSTTTTRLLDSREVGVDGQKVVLGIKEDWTCFVSFHFEGCQTWRHKTLLFPDGPSSLHPWRGYSDWNLFFWHVTIPENVSVPTIPSMVFKCMCEYRLLRTWIDYGSPVSILAPSSLHYGPELLLLGKRTFVTTVQYPFASVKISWVVMLAFWCTVHANFVSPHNYLWLRT